MKEEILEQMKMSQKKVDELVKLLEYNESEIKELLKDSKVQSFYNFLNKNENIKLEIASIKKEISRSIDINCTHPIAFYTNVTYCDYERREESEFICLECGEHFTDYYSRKNKIINTKKSFNELQNEYYELLNEYSACDAIEIMYNNYNNDNYKKMISEGIEPVKALKLLKIINERK